MSVQKEMASQEDGVLARIMELLAASANKDVEVGPDTKILADTSFDSVSVMDFVLELEDEFDITIPLNSLGDVETIGQLAGVIEKELGEN